MSVSPQAASYALTVEFTKCSGRAPGEMLSRDDTRLVYTPWLDREMRTFLVDYGRCRHSFHSSGLRANISSDGYLKALGRLVVDAAGRRVAKPGLPFLGIPGVLRSTPPDLEERRLAAHAVWRAPTSRTTAVRHLVSRHMRTRTAPTSQVSGGDHARTSARRAASLHHPRSANGAIDVCLLSARSFIGWGYGKSWQVLI